MTLSWDHTQPPAANDDDAHGPQFDHYTVEIMRQHENDEEEQLRDCSFEWEEPIGLQIDQQNCTASFKLVPGAYHVRVSANFEGGECISSEIKEIFVPKCK